MLAANNFGGDLWSDHPALFLVNVQTRADMEEKCNVHHTPKNASQQLYIDMVNQWRKQEVAETSRPGHQMKHHYMDGTICIHSFIQCKDYIAMLCYVPLRL